jgi:citronellol/citronellal dehydrogenase
MQTAKLKDKVIFITGASRGIGREIALRCARDGAKVIIAAKTAEPHPTLEGTIYSVAKEVEAAGGSALPLQLDVRDEVGVYEAVGNAVATFGGIDVLINNASAIALTSTMETSMKRFDLINTVNTRGTFVCSQACIPHLKKAANPHILTLSPPLNMQAKWFKDHLAYTLSK